jgi:hypothetical protein
LFAPRIFAARFAITSGVIAATPIGAILAMCSRIVGSLLLQMP